MDSGRDAAYPESQPEQGAAHMNRIVAGVVAAVVLSGCATVPQTPQEKILGVWTCAVVMGGLEGTSTMTYMPDGTATGPVTFVGETDGVEIDLSGNVKSTWQFLDDGRLSETVREFSVTTAKFDGDVMGPDLIASMIQPMIAAGIQGQEAVTDVTFDGPTMTMSAQDAEPTICKR